MSELEDISRRIADAAVHPLPPDAATLARLHQEHQQREEEHQRFLAEQEAYAAMSQFTYLAHDQRSSVRYFNLEQSVIFIEGRENESTYGEDMVKLSPTEALALLAWLQQEEAVLRELAKE